MNSGSLVRLHKVFATHVTASPPASYPCNRTPPPPFPSQTRWHFKGRLMNRMHIPAPCNKSVSRRLRVAWKEEAQHAHDGGGGCCNSNNNHNHNNKNKDLEESTSTQKVTLIRLFFGCLLLSARALRTCWKYLFFFFGFVFVSYIYKQPSRYTQQKKNLETRR